MYPFCFAGKPKIRRIAICQVEDLQNRENDRENVNDFSALQEELEGFET
jgi:hypothetical protein